MIEGTRRIILCAYSASPSPLPQDHPYRHAGCGSKTFASRLASGPRIPGPEPFFTGKKKGGVATPRLFTFIGKPYFFV